MNLRAGLLAIVLAGSFVAVNTVGGCSGDNDRGTPDASTTPDAGKKPDAGTKKPDAGTPVQPSNVGDACTGGSATTPQQGSCPVDYSCYDQPSDFPGGYCLKECSADEDCGSNGGVTNFCQLDEQDNGVCLRACDPAVGNSCNRPGYMCVRVDPQDPTFGLCLPDCRQNQGFCTGNTPVCNQTTGMCERQPGTKTAGQNCDIAKNDCVANTECLGTAKSNATCYSDCGPQGECPTGSICIQGLADVPVCMASCPQPEQQSTCGEGFRCYGLSTGTSGVCFQAPLPPGNLAQNGVCDASGTNEDAAVRCGQNLICVVASTGATEGTCLTNCTQSANSCPQGTQCIPLSGSTKACAQTCTASTTCPSGLTCQSGFCLK